jgi:hypothetical protein
MRSVQGWIPQNRPTLDFSHKHWPVPGSEEQPPIDLIRPFDADKMKAWRIDRLINNVKINEPSLDQPINDDAPIPEKSKPVEKPKRKPKFDDSGQLGCSDNQAGHQMP